MIITDIAKVLKNELNAALKRKQDIVSLAKGGDINRLKTKLENHNLRIIRSLKEYDIYQHDVMNRPDRRRKGKEPKPVCKIPIPYQKDINLQAAMFLFGNAPLLENVSGESTAEAFEVVKDILKNTHWESRIREVKEVAGSETIAAQLYYPYLDENENIEIGARVLSKSKGDEIYFRKDQRGKLIVAAHSYYTYDFNNVQIEHFDLYTKEEIYKCSNEQAVGWKVERDVNVVGKIPMLIYDEKVSEWHDVQPMCERRENTLSHGGDVNDYHADPKLMVTNLNVGSGLEPNDTREVINLREGGSASYLTYDGASQARRDEAVSLDKYIHAMSFSVDLSMDEMKGLGALSGVAFQYVFMGPILKAKRHQDLYGEMIDREMNVAIACAKLQRPDLDIRGDFDNLKIGFTFRSAMPDDIRERIEMITASRNNGTLSIETGVELNPLIRDKGQEVAKLATESDNLAASFTAQDSLF